MGGEDGKLKSEEMPEPEVDDNRHIKVCNHVPDPEEDDFDSKDEFIEYQNFAKEYNENLAFDIKTFVPMRLGDPLAVRPFDTTKKSDQIYLLCEKAIRDVLKYLHKQNEHSLEFIEIIRLNYRGLYMLFATFKARDKKTGEIQAYQSMVHCGFIDFRTSIYIFKKEGDRIEKKVIKPFSDKRSEYTFHKISKPASRWVESEKFIKECEQYAKEHNESEGFDIEHFTDSLMGGRSLSPVPKTDKNLFKHCTQAVKVVLDYLKSTGEQNLELVRIIKANYKSICLYFVTFEAKNEDSGEIKAYQSVIYHGFFRNKETHLYMFREKKGKVVPAVTDLREGYKFEKAETIDFADFRKFDDFLKYEKYRKEYDDSEGFHIFTKCERGGTITCVPTDKELFQDCAMALDDVLEYLNSKYGIELELVKIIRANYKQLELEPDMEDGKSNYTFFITFTAKDKDSKIKTYQSVISLDDGDQTKLQMLRKKRRPSRAKKAQMMEISYVDRRSMVF